MRTNVSKSTLTTFDPFSSATVARRETGLVEIFVVVPIPRGAAGRGLVVEQDDVTPSEQQSSDEPFSGVLKLNCHLKIFPIQTIIQIEK